MALLLYVRPSRKYLLRPVVSIIWWSKMPVLYSTTLYSYHKLEGVFPLHNTEWSHGLDSHVFSNTFTPVHAACPLISSQSQPGEASSWDHVLVCVVSSAKNTLSSHPHGELLLSLQDPWAQSLWNFLRPACISRVDDFLFKPSSFSAHSCINALLTWQFFCGKTFSLMQLCADLLCGTAPYLHAN